MASCPVLVRPVRLIKNDFCVEAARLGHGTDRRGLFVTVVTLDRISDPQIIFQMTCLRNAVSGVVPAGALPPLVPDGKTLPGTMVVIIEAYFKAR